MRSITFTLRPEVEAKEREALLKRLAALAGVVQAQALRPESKSASVRRMCFVRVEDDADIEGLRRRIADAPEVETAEVPPERRLM